MNNNQHNPYTDPVAVSLRENVTEVMRQYFANLKGEEPSNVYNFFLDEIEEPLITAVMKYTNNNQSETARILGLSRGTLRAKLKKFGLL